MATNPPQATYTPIHALQDSSDTSNYAGFITRLAAYLLDFYLFYVPAVILSIVLPIVLRQSEIYVSYISTFTYYLYLVISIKQWGQTLGKKMFAIRVVREDSKTIGCLRAIIREFVGKTLSSIFFIGFLYSLINKKNQTFHDKFARTVVIQQTPLTQFQKLLRIFVIVMLPIVGMVIMTTVLSTRLTIDQRKIDLIQTINEKIEIISMGAPLLQQDGINGMELYQNEVKILCKQQYLYKSECKLEDLNNENLGTLNEKLEEMINQMLEIQNRSSE